jgi:CRP-like cAMP-binding protein
MSSDPAERVRNRLLRRLPPQTYQRLLPHFKTLSFKSGDVLYEAHSQIEFVYFPQDCVLSAVTMMEDGSGIEVGTIGHEGAGGLAAFIGPSMSPHRMLVQVPGDGLRIEAAILARDAKESPALFDLLLKHFQAFLSQMSQSVACNGLHPIVKRCCRWLLMTHDRVGHDELPLTHEFLSFMLGVRRPGVSETLQALEDKGVIANSRGTVRIIDRAGVEGMACECYRIVLKEYERLLGADVI